MIELMRRINPDFKEVHQSSIEYGTGETAWQVNIITENGMPISGGFGTNLEQARKVAAAEFLERSTVQRLKADESLKKEWLLDVYPTACGFAAGFDKESTKLRSIMEGLERWVVSKWIDDNYHMNEEDSPHLESLGQYFVSQFDDCRFFFKSLPVLIGDRIVVARVAVVVAFSESGAFPGYSAGLEGENVWTHALLEGMRHLLIARNSPRVDRFPYNRIFYFSDHRQKVEAILSKNRREKWPTPQPLFFHSETFDGFYMSRTIFKGWKSWHDGPIDRFLY
ncbi:MAG: hypothetical protein H6626_10855 [Pseudobdellovibrionaceae bacterium]|nr:MAG: hypothetical protein H6626_10855 [Pseudobdellovibrionaceae bacterium]